MEQMKFAILFLIGILIAVHFLYCPRDHSQNYEAKGIDVSHYQRQIHWDSVEATGRSFALVKATEGVRFRDSLFPSNWENLSRVRMTRGAYHFFRPAFSAHEQFEHFQEVVQLEAGDLPPILDVETLDGVSRVELLAGMYVWLYKAEIAYGVRPIIYTNQGFYNQYLLGAFEGYPLWIARYSRRPPKLLDDQKWLFWQYRSSGTIPGIRGFVDENVFRASPEALQALTIQEEQVSAP